MTTQHGSPFELSGRLAVLVDTTSKDFPSHTQVIGKSLESISAWRGQLKKELEVKDADILASKTSVELLYDKVHEVEKEKRMLCASIDQEIPKRAVVADKFGHLQAALQAATDHSGRLRAISEQYPKALKDQSANRNFLSDKLQNLLKAAASFKSQQESSRKKAEEKVTAVGRKESLADRNYAKLRTEEDILVDDVKEKIAGIVHYRGRLKTPSSAVQELSAEFIDLAADEEKILAIGVEVQELVAEVIREENILDREQKEYSGVTTELETETEEYRSQLADVIVTQRESQQQSLEDMRRVKEMKADIFETLRVQEERLMVLREKNLEARKNGFLERKTALEERNKEIEESLLRGQSAKNRLSSDLQNAEQENRNTIDEISRMEEERKSEEDQLKIQLQHLISIQKNQAAGMEKKLVHIDHADSAIKLKQEEIRRLKTAQDAEMKILRDLEASEDRIRVEIADTRVLFEEAMAAIASKKDASVTVSLAARERQEKEAGSFLETARQEKNDVLAKIAETSSLIARAESEKTSKTSKLTTEKEKERRSLAALELAKNQQKQAAEAALLKKKISVSQDRTERTVLVENAVSPKVKAAAVTGKRYPAQPDPLESPSKRSYSGVPRGRTQNVEEEPHSGSQMSQSSDDSNVSYHVPMRVAAADMPKIPPNFGRLTLSFNDDEEPQREFMTLDDY